MFCVCNFTMSAKDNHTFKIAATSPRPQCVKTNCYRHQWVNKPLPDDDDLAACLSPASLTVLCRTRQGHCMTCKTESNMVNVSLSRGHQGSFCVWPRAAYRYRFFDIDTNTDTTFRYRYQFDPYRDIHETILSRVRLFYTEKWWTAIKSTTHSLLQLPVQ